MVSIEIWKIIIILFCGGVFYLSLKRTIQSIYLLVFIAPLYLVRFSVFKIPTSLLEVLIYIVFFGWLIKKIRQNKIKTVSFFREYQWPILLLSAGLLVGAFYSPNLRASLGIVKGWFFDPLLVFILVVNELKDLAAKKTIFKILFYSGFLMAIISLGYLATGNLSFDGRLAAFFSSPNMLAMYLAPTLIIGIGLVPFYKKSNDRLLMAVGVITIMVAIFYTQSYGAWVAILIGALFIFFSKTIYKISLKNKVIILLVAMIILGWSQVDGRKFKAMVVSPSSSLQSRLIIWGVSADIIKSNWLIGIGPGAFQSYYLAYQKYYPPYLEWSVPQPHNIFLAFWLQAGLVGLVGFLWLIWRFFNNIFKQKTSTCLAPVLAAVMIYILVHGLVDTTYWRNDLSLIFWVIVALSYKGVHHGGLRKKDNLLPEKE